MDTSTPTTPVDSLLKVVRARKGAVPLAKSTPRSVPDAPVAPAAVAPAPAVVLAPVPMEVVETPAAPTVKVPSNPETSAAPAAEVAPPKETNEVVNEELEEDSAEDPAEDPAEGPEGEGVMTDGEEPAEGEESEEDDAPAPVVQAPVVPQSSDQMVIKFFTLLKERNINIDQGALMGALQKGGFLTPAALVAPITPAGTVGSVVQIPVIGGVPVAQVPEEGKFQSKPYQYYVAWMIKRKQSMGTMPKWKQQTPEVVAKFTEGFNQRIPIEQFDPQCQFTPRY